MIDYSPGKASRTPPTKQIGYWACGFHSGLHAPSPVYARPILFDIFSLDNRRMNNEYSERDVESNKYIKI